MATDRGVGVKWGQDPQSMGKYQAAAAEFDQSVKRHGVHIGVCFVAGPQETLVGLPPVSVVACQVTSKLAKMTDAQKTELADLITSQVTRYLVEQGLVNMIEDS